MTKKVASRNVKDFFNNEVREYSIYACQRAIPSGIDGLKTSQRKVLYGMMKEYPTQEIKVSISSANIMAVTAFHHGALDGVMVNMAQSFPGSNNVPLLEGIGQFGSRLSPDAAASRYIFTKLTADCKQIFRSVDDAILEWLDDDGMRIEPKFYLPVIPMVLVNGAEGMGTGFASRIFGYNPDTIVKAINLILSDKKEPRLVPWYRKFNGKIERSTETEQTMITGILEVVNTTTIKISELPIGYYTIKYRETLNALEDKGLIKSWDDNSTEEKTEFIVKVPRELTSTKESIPELLKIFKLVSKDTENLTVWDENDKLRKFTSANELLQWFVSYRLTRYEDRRLYLIQSTMDLRDKLDEQMRFIQLYLKRSKAWSTTKIVDIKAELESSGFKFIDDLLNIRIQRLTQDAIDELATKIKSANDEIVRLKTLTAKDLYKQDLAQLKL